MKQYVSKIWGERIKKVPLPVAYHLNQAVGALTLHTGRNYMLYYGHKKCPQQYGEPSRLIQMVSTANIANILMAIIIFAMFLPNIHVLAK